MSDKKEINQSKFSVYTPQQVRDGYIRVAFRKKRKDLIKTIQGSKKEYSSV